MLEHNKKFLKMNFKKKYEQKRNSDHSLPDNISFDEFLEKIEFPLKQQNKFQFIKPYMKWIVQKYVANGIRYFEDIHSKTIPALLTYDILKRKNKLKTDYRDINKIKSLNELLDILDEYEVENTKSNKEQEKDIEQKFYDSGEAELIYNDSEIKVVVPKTEKASCFFGRNTRWCTAATQSNNLFWDYTKKGDLYIVLIKKNNERYQFHFENGQFMNQYDEPINPFELAEKYPKLYDIFEPIAKRKKLIFFQRNPSEEDKFTTVNINPYAIKYIENPSEKIKLVAVKKSGLLIQYIENPSERVQIAAVKKCPLAIQYIINPSEKVQLAAVKKHGFVIQYIKNPSENAQLAAIKKFARFIEYIENPSEKVQLAAVKKNSRALQYIKHPTEEVKLVAVKKCAKIIQYIENPSEAVQLIVVEKNPKLIKYIKNPTESVLREVVKQNPEAIIYIKNPTPKVLELVKRLKNENSRNITRIQ